MPFREHFEGAYEKIQEIAVIKHEMTCVRADNIYSAGVIIEEIWEKIQEAGIIVADCTDKNPNVLYEIGLAHAIGKDDQVILISQSIEDIPFDLRHRRIITYDPNKLDALAVKLSKTIEKIRGKTPEIHLWLKTTQTNVRVGLSTPINNYLATKTPIPASGRIIGLDNTGLRYSIQGFVITDKEYQQGTSNIDSEGYWSINEIHLGATTHTLFFRVFDESGRTMAKTEEITILKKNA